MTTETTQFLYILLGVCYLAILVIKILLENQNNLKKTRTKRGKTQ